MKISRSTIQFSLKKIILLTILTFTVQSSLHGMSLRNSVDSLLKKASSPFLKYSTISAETTNSEKFKKCLIYGTAGITIAVMYGLFDKAIFKYLQEKPNAENIDQFYIELKDTSLAIFIKPYKNFIKTTLDKIFENTTKEKLEKRKLLKEGKLDYLIVLHNKEWTKVADIHEKIKNFSRKDIEENNENKPINLEKIKKKKLNKLLKNIEIKLKFNGDMLSISELSPKEKESILKNENISITIGKQLTYLQVRPILNLCYGFCIKKILLSYFIRGKLYKFVFSIFVSLSFIRSVIIFKQKLSKRSRENEKIDSPITSFINRFVMIFTGLLQQLMFDYLEMFFESKATRLEESYTKMMYLELPNLLSFIYESGESHYLGTSKRTFSYHSGVLLAGAWWRWNMTSPDKVAVEPAL